MMDRVSWAIPCVGYTEPRRFARWGGIKMAQYLEVIADADGKGKNTVGRSKSEWVSVWIAIV